MEMDREFANKGVAGAGLGLGIAGTALGLLNGGIPGLLGGARSVAACGCSEDHPVDRYTLSLEQKISEQNSQLALRDANFYQSQQQFGMYKDYSDKINAINAQLAQQAVINAQLTANIACMQGQIAALNGLTKTVIPITNVCPQPAVATTTAA